MGPYSTKTAVSFDFISASWINCAYEMGRMGVRIGNVCNGCFGNGALSIFHKICAGEQMRNMKVVNYERMFESKKSVEAYTHMT